MNTENGFDIEKEASLDLNRESIMKSSDVYKDVEEDVKIFKGMNYQGNHLANSIMLEKHLKKMSDEILDGYKVTRITSYINYFAILCSITSIALVSFFGLLFSVGLALFWFAFFEQKLFLYSMRSQLMVRLEVLLSNSIMDDTRKIKSEKTNSKISKANQLLSGLLITSQNNLLNISRETLKKQINKAELDVASESSRDVDIDKIREKALRQMFERINKIYLRRLIKSKRGDLEGINFYINYKMGLLDKKTMYSPLEFVVDSLCSKFNNSLLIKKLELRRNEKEIKKLKKLKAIEEKRIKAASFQYSEDEDERFFQEVLGESGENVSLKVFTNQIK